MSYVAVDLARCRNLKHKLKLTWSDKTPLKVSLLCDTESVNGVNAYAAYGDETKSWGQWRRKQEETE